MAVHARIPVQCGCGARDQGEPGEVFRCAACGRIFRLPEAPAQVAAVSEASHDHAVLVTLTLCLALTVALVIAWASAALTGRELLPLALAFWALAIVPALGRRRRAARAGVQALRLH